MRVVLAGTPMIGHLNPLLSIGRLLLAQGHDVVGHSASAHRHRFEAAGLSFEPFDRVIDQDLGDLDRIDPALKALPPGPEKLRHLFQHAFIDRLAAQYASLRGLLERSPADLVVADNMFVGTLPFLLGDPAQRPAIVHCGVTPLVTSRDDGAPNGPGLPPAAGDGLAAGYGMIRQLVDQAFFLPIQRGLDQALASVGRGPLDIPMNDAIVTLPDLFLQPTVAGFEYPRKAPPASLRFIGALPLPSVRVALPDWAADVAKAEKVVLVTQGTLANHELGDVIAPTLAALEGRPDVLVLVTTGGRPLDAIPGTIPDNARLAQFLPYDWLMPHVDLVVTNGGYGTVNLALSHGVPLVVAGVSEDKAEVGARVAWSGVGIGLKTDTPTASALRAAIESVLDDDRYRLAAEAMAVEFSKADSERQVLRLLATTVAGHAAIRDALPA